MTWSQEISQLVTGVDQLTSAVNVKKSTLDATTASIETAKNLTANSAVAASNSAASSLTSSQTAETHKNTALAIYGTSAAQQTAIASTQASSFAASGSAADGSAALQQNLSGINVAALHRSPNAITSMFVYDTSKDSDGGAWTEKCQHTSWWNEPLMGKWLGSHSLEREARLAGASVGPELVTNGTFASGDLTGWTNASTGTGTASIENGLLRIVRNGSGNGGAVTQNISVVSGKLYVIEFTYSGAFQGYMMSSSTTPTGRPEGNNFSPGSYRWVFVANSSSSTLRFEVAGSTVGIGFFDNISVRELISVTTASGDYYQATSDGKFYRLWKNRLRNTSDLSTNWGTGNGGVLTPNADGLTPLFTGTSSGTSVISQTFTSITETLTFSLEAKTFGSPGQIQLRINNSDAARGLFTLSGAGTATVDSSSNTTVSIIALSDGYYRCTVSATVPSATSSVEIRLYGSVGTDRGYYVRNAQLESGTSFTSYEYKGVEGTISEVFRGNKRDFPKLAAIVAEASNVTIYDLTEPGRPMWMRFVGSGSGSFQRIMPEGNSTTSLVAREGLIIVGHSQNAVLEWNFTRDFGQQRYGSGIFSFTLNQIGSRMTASARFNSSTANGLASNVVNDVATTVLPNAQIDPTTGLKIPTIAVATGSGVSVIQTNGTVANFTSTGRPFSHTVFWGERGELYATFANSDFNYGGLIRIPNPSISATLGDVSFVDSDDFMNIASSVNLTRPSSTFFFLRSTTGFVRMIKTPNGLMSSLALYNTGVSRLLWGKTQSSDLAANFYIGPDFNTGWMVGRIRRCYLTDTDTTSVNGTELVTNGTFVTDTTGWTLAGGTTSVDLNGVTITNVAGRATLSQTITTVVGKLYTVSGILNNLTSGITAATIRITSTNSYAGTLVTQFNSTGGGDIPFSFTFTSPSSTLYIWIANNTTTNGNTIRFDNISTRQVIGNRSYNSAVAIVNGTLTRTQLASGTSLVGYSGFSAANYLRESYSADLDFGTGEFSTSAWVNIPTSLPTANFPIIGSELVTNGDFSLGTGWTLGAGWSISSGQLVATSVAFAVEAKQSIPSLVGGKYYAISFDAVVTSGAFKVNLSNYGRSDTELLVTASGSYVYRTMFPVNNTTQVTFWASTTFTGSIDNVSVREVSPAIIVERAAASGPRLRVGVGPAGNLTAEAFDGTTARIVNSPATYNSATWSHVSVNYTTDGSLSLLVNGREVAVTRGTPLLTLNNASAVLTIGNNFALDAPFPGSIALLKMSATVPTPEQTTFMYEQEKQLFRANAQSVLPDAGSIVDLSYDDATDRWVSLTATNESYWSGLVRTSVTPSPAGSYSRVVATSGIELSARTTTNPGVDITIPAYNLREELPKRAEPSAKLARQSAVFDYIGGFTATTTSGSTALTVVANLTYPTSYIGARISGTGIPANTFITGVSATTIYISAPASASASNVSITFLDFELPVGFVPDLVSSAGTVRREGATLDYIRLFDGFVETIRFAVAPGATTWVQIKASRPVS